MTRPDIPQEFKDYARRLLSAERYARFAQALDEDPSVSVRLNPFKAVWSGLLAEDLNGVDGSVPVCHYHVGMSPLRQILQ